MAYIENDGNISLTPHSLNITAGTKGVTDFLLNEAMLLDAQLVARNKKPKFFIFEGLEGSGKTTCMKVLSKYYTDLGSKVLVETLINQQYAGVYYYITNILTGTQTEAEILSLDTSAVGENELKTIQSLLYFKEVPGASYRTLTATSITMLAVKMYQIIDSRITAIINEATSGNYDVVVLDRFLTSVMAYNVLATNSLAVQQAAVGHSFIRALDLLNNLFTTIQINVTCTELARLQRLQERLSKAPSAMKQNALLHGTNRHKLIQMAFKVLTSVDVIQESEIEQVVFNNRPNSLENLLSDLLLVLDIDRSTGQFIYV